MLNYQVIDFMAGQLADQYAKQKAAGFSYPNEEELPKFFRAQAAKLAANGVTSIYDVAPENGGIVNTATNEPIKDVVLKSSWETDPEAYRFRDTVKLEDRGGFTRWGKDLSVQGQADYGLNFVDGVPVYTPFWKDTSTDMGTLVLGGALIAGGLYGLSTLGGAAAGTAGTGAAGTGLTAGAGGVTGLTSGAAGVTGLTAPAGFTLAPGVGASLAAGGTGIGLLDGAYTSSMGETGLLSGAAGEGLTVPTTPGLSSMGGAQGLTVPVAGGTVSQLGLIPVGATPVLGDPSSFINDPNVLGKPVFTTDTISYPGTESGISAQDALRAANTVKNMLAQPTVQQQAGLLGGGGGQARGVDYSGLLPTNVVGLLPLAEPYRRSLL